MVSVNKTPGAFAGGEPQGLRIIYYHRFHYDRAAEALDAQCEYLRSRYDPIPIDQVPAALAEGRSFQRPPLIVAVDDGHRDFLELAMPLFKKHNIPAICYLVSDFIDGVDWLWFDKVDFLCTTSSKDRLEIALSNGKELQLGMTHSRDRRKAATKLKEALKSLPYHEFVAALEGLPSAMDVVLPQQPPTQFAPLKWDEVRKMSQLGMWFGSHTRTHPILSRITDVQRISDEMLNSKKRIEEELQMPVLHFAYPNGRLLDIAPECPVLLREIGFRTAVTTVYGLNDVGTDVFHLKRIWVEPFLEISYFQQRVSGFADS